MLARIYGFSVQSIADMTPYQQLMMLDMDDDEKKATNNQLVFETFAQYMTWRKDNPEKK